ncbi:MAG TPA: hypothetical protein VGN16_00205 [Acidobacteriaceae bacterium]|jgi:hypothetical protein
MMARAWVIALPFVALAVAGAGWWKSQQGDTPVSSAAADTLRRAAAAAPAPRAFYGRRLEPKEPVVLHGAGQSDESSFAAYSKAVAPAKPMLTMSYIDLREDVPSYFGRLRVELARYPDLLIPQIGLSLNSDDAKKHYEADIARGVDDARLKLLCDGLRSLDRPVFLRVGYEFNGPWNGYVASSYVAAFRHITETIRACGLDNVAIVWDWSVGAELDAESGGANAADAAKRYMAFYPGDAWVDWWGLNIFSATDTWTPATKAFLADAERHRMPVIIGESTPKGHSVQEGSRILDAWYKPYFGLIHTSPGIKAFCYIDWDWSIYPQWADWGDGRIEQDPTVLGFYRAEVQRPLYAGARSRAETLALLRAH